MVVVGGAVWQIEQPKSSLDPFVRSFVRFARSLASSRSICCRSANERRCCRRPVIPPRPLARGRRLQCCAAAAAVAGGSWWSLQLMLPLTLAKRCCIFASFSVSLCSRSRVARLDCASALVSVVVVVVGGCGARPQSDNCAGWRQDLPQTIAPAASLGGGGGGGSGLCLCLCIEGASSLSARERGKLMGSIMPKLGIYRQLARPAVAS